MVGTVSQEEAARSTPPWRAAQCCPARAPEPNLLVTLWSPIRTFTCDACMEPSGSGGTFSAHASRLRISSASAVLLDAAGGHKQAPPTNRVRPRRTCAASRHITVLGTAPSIARLNAVCSIAIASTLSISAFACWYADDCCATSRADFPSQSMPGSSRCSISASAPCDTSRLKPTASRTSMPPGAPCPTPQPARVE